MMRTIAPPPPPICRSLMDLGQVVLLSFLLLLTDVDCQTGSIDKCYQTGLIDQELLHRTGAYLVNMSFFGQILIKTGNLYEC